MANSYILGSAVANGYVPIGKPFATSAEAEASARDLNSLLPSLRLKVLTVALDNLDSQPQEIRDFVLGYLDPRARTSFRRSMRAY